MQLNVTFVRGSDGRERPVITDDRGHVMPCVRAVTVNYDVESATEVTIKLVVNRRDVVIGALETDVHR